MIDEGSATFAQRGGRYVLRLQGAVRYTIGHALDAFLDRVFADASFEDLVIDLGDLESIDSTGLGLLAKAANFVRKHHGRKPLLFSPNADINTLLHSMCLDRVFVICDSRPDAAAEALPATEPGEAELARTVLDAHRLLCDLSPENKTLFQNVVDALEAEAAEPERGRHR